MTETPESGLTSLLTTEFGAQDLFFSSTARSGLYFFLRAIFSQTSRREVNDTPLNVTALVNGHH